MKKQILTVLVWIGIRISLESALPTKNAFEGLCLYLGSTTNCAISVLVRPWSPQGASIVRRGNDGIIQLEPLPKLELDQQQDVNSLPLPTGVVSEHGQFIAMRGTVLSLLAVNPSGKGVTVLQNFTNSYNKRTIINRIYESDEGPICIGNVPSNSSQQHKEEAVVWRTSLMVEEILDLTSLGDFAFARPWGLLTNGDIYGYVQYPGYRSVPWCRDVGGTVMVLPSMGQSAEVLDAAFVHTNQIAVGQIGNYPNGLATVWKNNKVAYLSDPKIGRSALLTVNSDSGLAGGYYGNRQGSIVCALTNVLGLTNGQIIKFEDFWKQNGGGTLDYHSCGIHAITKVGSVVYFSIFGEPWIIAAIDTAKPKLFLNIHRLDNDGNIELWFKKDAGRKPPVGVEYSNDSIRWETYPANLVDDGEYTRVTVVNWLDPILTTTLFRLKL